MTPRPIRFAVLASHPIQYFTPLYQRLARAPGIELEVLYYRDFGVAERFDKQFGQSIRWDTDQLAGYRHRFLYNVSPVSDTFNPLHAVNPGAFTRILRGVDVIWLNGYTYPSNWFAALAAAMRGTKILFRSELRLDDTRRKGLAGKLRRAVIRQWVTRADALLYIGSANREAYLHYGASLARLFFSPYSVDVDRIARAQSQRPSAELRRQRGIPPDRVVIAYVGKLTQRKHPEAVIGLAAEPSLRGRVHVVIAGSGPLEAELRADAQQRGLANVSFLGFVNQSELPSVYALADIFAFPSEREPWGLVLNEAMAAGVAPVVSDEVGAAADLIVQGDSGFVFPSRDWAALARHVRALVDDEGLRRRIGAAARARSALFHFDATVEGILSAIDAVLPGRRRASVTAAA